MEQRSWLTIYRYDLGLWFSDTQSVTLTFGLVFR